jgi:hypothetical protein
MTLLEQPRTRRPVRLDQPRDPRHAPGWIPGWVIAVLAAAAWVPFIDAPASPDEGGYLVVAAQWQHGSSLYGNYWVDRPPLLIVIHQLAVVLGGVQALRIIGMAAVLASVVLAGALAGATTASRRSSAVVVPTVLAAVFLTTPLFGTTHVDGELLTVPFVLAGLLGLARAFAAARRKEQIAWAVLAGVAAAGAVMVKQNAIDVFVVAAALVVGRPGSAGRTRSVRIALAFGSAAVMTLGALIGVAAWHGTDPAALWNAVVTFRFRAAGLIDQYSTATNAARQVGLLEAFGLSLAPLLLGVLAVRLFRRGPAPRVVRDAADLRWPAVALLAWEAVSVAAGGSYWLHYLLVLVPGMVLLAVAAEQRPPALRRTLAVVLSAAVASAALATTVAARRPPDYPSDARAVAYLRAHARPGDTATVAFGHPDILWDAGLQSPYPQLWSLPVRVRDPHLAGLSKVLASPSAPTWVVVSGSSLSTWGVDATEADALLRSRYRDVAQLGRYVVWHVAG